MIHKIKYRIIFSTLFTTALIFPLVTSALNTNATGYRINAATNKKIDAHGICKIVYNQSGKLTRWVDGGALGADKQVTVTTAWPDKSFFIPTLTKEEWESFILNKPREIWLVDCAVTSVHTGNSSGTDIYWHYYRDINGEKFSL